MMSNETYPQEQSQTIGKMVSEPVDYIPDYGFMLMCTTIVGLDGAITTTALTVMHIQKIMMAPIKQIMTEVVSSKEEKEEWQTMYM